MHWRCNPWIKLQGQQNANAYIKMSGADSNDSGEILSYFWTVLYAFPAACAVLCTSRQYWSLRPLGTNLVGFTVAGDDFVIVT